MRRGTGGVVGGFTLIELLCVVAIIGVLASLLMPTFSKMTERANNLKCQSNLRQIGVAAHLAANDHNNTFPPVEFDVSNPAYTAEEAAKPLSEVFKAYGITAEILKCAEDVRGANWFRSTGASYLWKPQSADEETASITVYRRSASYELPPSRVQLATDYEAVHLPEQTGARKRMNVVYADGHVVSR